ncbi:MAG: Photosystem I assembly protein Ycf3 [Verrucomicrobia subdivision 3 bacterium]|nr:Photosystem I assembly protein Ycf3 [Limisphaerales bacterium]MCS1417040.1 Photosystem I assembly protein Ycf3 [Limisphaerales bacterium]
MQVFWLIVAWLTLPHWDREGQAASPASPATETNLIEQEYFRILELDDAALKKIDEWIRASQRPDASEAKTITLGGRINNAIKPVKEAYEAFIKAHPDHVHVRLAFASFLTDIGEEHAALPHLKKAIESDPALPAAWNNLANYYGHNGEIKKAFTHYEKAIEINPKESVYYHNFGTTVFLFRKDVKEHYQITESEVFDKALTLYQKALELDPKNFDLAEDIAQIYYGIRTTDSPSQMARPKEALKAWKRAESLAPGDFEREGVVIHLARTHIDMGNFKAARREIDRVTLPIYKELKEQVSRRIPETNTEIEKE